MKLNEKKDFGKKPVRRSKTEEKEPARVYRPRTAKFKLDKDDRSAEKPYEIPKRETREKTVDFDKTTPEKGYEPNTGYRRKTSKSSSFESQSDTKRGNRKDSRDSDSAPRKPLRRTDKDSDNRSYREKDKKEGGNSFGRGTDRDKSFEKKRTKEFGRDRFEKPKGFRKDDQFGEKRKDDRKFGTRKSSGKVLSRNKSEEADFQKPGKFSKRAPLIEADLTTDSEGFIRLNKYIANSGLCSRREADEYIQNGMITVNGVTIDQLGSKVKLTDEIRFKGKELDPEKKIYILLNKPKDYITTVEDPNAKQTVMELIKGACKQRVYPVGRLDRNSTGLLLLTNDGELTKRLTHPSFLKKKVYEVGLEKPLEPSDLKAIVSGVELEDEIVRADAVEYIDETDRSQIGIEIHSGQNRVVRRIFEKLGYRVQKLDRVYFAGLTKKNLPRGKWRFLSENEVTMLRMNRF